MPSGSLQRAWQGAMSNPGPLVALRHNLDKYSSIVCLRCITLHISTFSLMLGHRCLLARRLSRLFIQLTCKIYDIDFGRAWLGDLHAYFNMQIPQIIRHFRYGEDSDTCGRREGSQEEMR